MPTDAEIHALANAAWDVLCEIGYDAREDSEVARANLRVAFEPFRPVIDPHDLAPPPFGLAAAEACLRDAEAEAARERTDPVTPAEPPLSALYVIDDAHGYYQLCAHGRGRVAGAFVSIEAAQAHVARRYGISLDDVKSRVPTRMASPVGGR